MTEEKQKVTCNDITGDKKNQKQILIFIEKVGI